MVPSGRERDGESQEKRKKNRDPAEPGKGTVMQVPIQGWRCDPTVRGRQIAYEPGQNKGKQQRPYESAEVEKYQLIPLSKVRSCKPFIVSATLSMDALILGRNGVQLFHGIFRRNRPPAEILHP